MSNSLTTSLRNDLRKVTLNARRAAEKACRASLENLAVHEADYRSHMNVEQRQLRNRLRARGRALGDELDRRTGAQSIQHLVEDAAYEQWHRLLFTRFLAENDLLHTDEENGNVQVTLDDCEELAQDLGARDGFDLACRFSSETLPGVFRTNDPILELPLPTNNQVELRGLLDSIPSEAFSTDDALGWTYQFWQEERKDEVNASGEKIGADELSPVTQLFTEDYMVEFLLHNTLGAWWAGKLGPITATTEEEARSHAALSDKGGIGVTWTYLRFIQDEKTKTWSPAAGTFDGWPKEAKDVTFLDPCMGSGHFPVFALPILARLRMEEESLSAAVAIHSVLSDNIHGLELDARCCQIGAFNLALTAWKLAGYQALPSLHVACCGLAPQAKKEDWLKLAGDSDKLKRGMEKLYDLFKQAPVLGSLINPRLGGGDLLDAGFEELQPLLEKAMDDEGADEAAQELAVTAQGIAKAAEMLAAKYDLVITNVPFLKSGDQCNELSRFIDIHHSESKANLAYVMLSRMFELTCTSGLSAVVCPQAWQSQVAYSNFRDGILRRLSISLIAPLGAGAFETISGEVVNVGLYTFFSAPPSTSSNFVAIDANEAGGPARKARHLHSGDLVSLIQVEQNNNPDKQIKVNADAGSSLLAEAAGFSNGIQTGDRPRHVACFWEFLSSPPTRRFMQSTVNGTRLDGGCEYSVCWDYHSNSVPDAPGSVIRGGFAWSKSGVLVSAMDSLPVARYSGELYDENCVALIPNEMTELGAIWSFCSSPEYTPSVRKICKALKVRRHLIQVPFDLEHWQKVAAEKYPDGLPKPHSDDPTQWIFNGQPKGSEQPLQVAVARLLGYRWPRQTGSSFPDCPAIDEPDGLEEFADEDGIVCLSAINREATAASRLRKLLSKALGNYDERALIKATGSTKTNLEDWLRDDFFKCHTTLFHKRPFVWHLWDGLKDGFHVLVNYHELDEATLKTLTYTYLGDWIREQKAGTENDTPGAAERLGAATGLQQKLIAILEGEAPLDIFVRWKPIDKQAIGWNPDLNDGVRLNIRPFLLAGDVGLKGAGLFRVKPGIELKPKPKPDRGKEPLRDKADYPWFWCAEDPGTDPVGDKDFTGKRWNTAHLSLKRKREVKS